MAHLDVSIKQFMTDDEFNNLLAKMELKEAKEFRYFDNNQNEHKLTQKQALLRVNRRIKSYNHSLTLSWVKKWWSKL